MALRLPRPCRPQTGLPTLLFSHPPCHQCSSLSPMTQCDDRHSNDPMDGVRAFLLGTAQDRGAGRS